MAINPISESKKYIHKNKTNILKYTDAFFSAVALFCGLQLTTYYMKEDSSANVLGLIMFFVIALSRLFTAFALDKSERLRRVKNFAFVLLYIACAVVYCFVKSDLVALSSVSLVYFSEIIVNRVVAMIEKKTVKGYILNGIVCILVVLYLISLVESFFVPEEMTLYMTELIILSYLVAVRSLLHIIANSFSQMKLGVLRKVIRKTFAGEILFGMFMLIISFSMVFTSMEPDTFPSYFDALWYSFAVVTTIGFGDFAAVGIVARIGSVILGIYGLIVVAVITSVIINFYNETKNDMDDGGGEGASSDPSEEATSEGEATQEVAPSVDMKPKNINLTEKKKKGEKP